MFQLCVGEAEIHTEVCIQIQAGVEGSWQSINTVTSKVGMGGREERDYSFFFM